MERILLDVHAHLLPTDRLGADLADAAGDVSWDAKTETLRLEGQAHGPKALFRPHELIAWMDRNGVETAWISIPPLGYRQHLTQAQARAWLGALNEGLLALAERFPARFAPLFHLPVEHPALAHEIAAHWIGRGHARFAMAAGDGAKAMLSDASYEPLWHTLDAAAAFLFLHPAKICDARFEPFHLHNLVGNPTETAIAAAHLVVGGVIDRYPKLRICLAHGGGTSAAIAGRLERGRVTGRIEPNGANTDLRKKFRSFCVDCVVHDAAALKLAAEVHGAENVLFGSDWPYPMGLPEPHAQLADLDATLRGRIFCDNPARLTGASERSDIRPVPSS